MKILITGGAGFIGSHLAHALLKDGAKLTILDDLSRHGRDPLLSELEAHEDVQFLARDIREGDAFDGLGDDFDYIYHLAAIIGVINVFERPFEVLRDNVSTLVNALAFADSQKNLKRFVFTSTSEVYAGTLKHFGLEFPTPETTPLTTTNLSENRTSYMLSKIYGEALCNHSNVHCTIIRPHNFYGPRMGLNHVIPELLQRAYKEDANKPLDVFSPSHKRTFCYISDAVRFMIALSKSADSINQVYNVGNPLQEVAIEDLAQKVLTCLGSDKTLNLLEDTAGSPVRRVPDIAEAVSICGFEPEVSVDEGISKTWDWYKGNMFD